MDHALAEALEQVRSRLDARAREAKDWWLDHGVDHRHGGFYGRLDRTGTKAHPAVKSIVQQARHLWALSCWTERRGPENRAVQAAHATYDLIRRAFLDPADGEFFYTISEEGKVEDAGKLLYAQAFAIYGLSTYGRVFGHGGAIDQALRCFDSVERRAHDPEHGGYDERAECGLVRGDAPKDTNTHLHLMEALTALHLALSGPARSPPSRASAGLARALPRVTERLAELIALVQTRLLQPSGYVHKAFELDWTPKGPPVVSYGHDIETAWLLLEAARQLDQVTPRLERAVVAMGLHSTAGYDSELGGYFDEGIAGGAVTSREKVWWAQFEALAGLWWLYRLTGNGLHLQQLQRTLDWIEGPARDAEYGEWYFGILPGGSISGRGDHKGEIWKASYHNLRALILTADWIGEYLAARR